VTRWAARKVANQTHQRGEDTAYQAHMNGKQIWPGFDNYKCRKGNVRRQETKQPLFRASNYD
jgi:hypothetical protein